MTVHAPPVLQLQYKNKNQQVTIETETEDRFTLTVQAAIKACQAFGHMEEFTRQFRKLHTKLAKWVKKHEQQIGVAYLTARESAVLFLVVQKAKKFNRKFEDELTDLDIEIAQNEALNLIRVHVLSLPNCNEDAVESFLIAGGERP